ncbi:hypothetical protein CBS101457_003157 [Exobasidium rhododendri]|nr:hypothetical protein CBS101457_003157 [Exobasidium rhododendri]
MATDPYHTFAADLRGSLDTARQLSRRYKTLQSQRRGKVSSSSSASSSSLAESDNQLKSAYTELQDHLETLENDINDVQESVDMLERRGPELFGIDSTELDKRKRFVDSCTEEVRHLAKTVQEEGKRNRGDFHTIDMHNNASHDRYHDDDDEGEDPNLAFEMEQQQQLMSKQDNTLDLIGSTLNNLKRQAGTLGQEIGEQVELIGALDTEVDTSQSKLTRAMGRMDELVRRSDDRMGGWCVWLLVIVSLLICVGGGGVD